MEQKTNQNYRLQQYKVLGIAKPQESQKAKATANTDTNLADADCHFDSAGTCQTSA